MQVQLQGLIAVVVVALRNNVPGTSVFRPPDRIHVDDALPTVTPWNPSVPAAQVARHAYHIPFLVSQCYRVEQDLNGEPKHAYSTMGDKRTERAAPARSDRSGNGDCVFRAAQSQWSTQNIAKKSPDPREIVAPVYPVEIGQNRNPCSRRSTD